MVKIGFMQALPFIEHSVPPPDNFCY